MGQSWGDRGGLEETRVASARLASPGVIREGELAGSRTKKRMFFCRRAGITAAAAARVGPMAIIGEDAYLVTSACEWISIVESWTRPFRLSIAFSNTLAIVEQFAVTSARTTTVCKSESDAHDPRCLSDPRNARAPPTAGELSPEACAATAVAGTAVARVQTYTRAH